jgi:hypothetical protein
VKVVVRGVEMPRKQGQQLVCLHAALLNCISHEKIKVNKIMFYLQQQMSLF